MDRMVSEKERKTVEVEDGQLTYRKAIEWQVSQTLKQL